jgi:hypothetical protein
MILTLFFCSCISSIAAEYRYNLMATTGLQARVFDKVGKETTITFSKKSDPKVLFLLSKILELGINGTKDDSKWLGVPYVQAIILRGQLDPIAKRTKSAPHLAEAEDYQEFTLQDVVVRFPLSRHRAGKVFDTGYIETHFSFETLLPEGLVYNGNKIDLNKHSVKSEKQKHPSQLLENTKK